MTMARDVGVKKRSVVDPLSLVEGQETRSHHPNVRPSCLLLPLLG
jgi:hypothetical protein